MCVDLCPTDVFDHDEAADLATAARSEDCIGCLSCFYICPSQCVVVDDVHTQRPFHRLEGNVALVEKLLQAKSASATLTAEDWAEATKDVSSTLVALSASIVEMMGRAHKALGRKSGALSAAHLPEVYEGEGLDGVLEALQRRFKHCFDFEANIEGEKVGLTFSPCSLMDVVKSAGQEPGEAISCQLFHEYFAGLLGAFTGTNYAYEVNEVGSDCKLSYQPK